MEVVYVRGISKSINGEIRAGLGVYFGPDDPRNCWDKLKGSHQTSNRAEIMASIVALQLADKFHDIKIISTSKYLIRTMGKWIKTWESNEWLTKDDALLENKDFFKKLRSIEMEILDRGKNTVWAWHEENAKVAGSEAAHKLAIKGLGLWRENPVILPNPLQERMKQVDVKSCPLSTSPRQCDIYVNGTLKTFDGDKKAGVGVYFGEDDPRNYTGKLEGEVQTKHRAHLMATIVALQRVDRSSDVRIISNCKYLTYAMGKWIKKWEKNGWLNRDKEPILHKDLIKKIRTLEMEILANDKTVIWRWYHKNSGLDGSEKACHLAKKGVGLWWKDPTILPNPYKAYDDLDATPNKIIIPTIPGQLNIYVDGSCKFVRGEERGGVGVYFGEGDPRNYSGPLEGTLQTNNRAEIMACIIALERMNEQSDVNILTDSRYVVDSMTIWIKKWEVKNWMRGRNKPVLNKDLLMRLATLERVIVNNGYKVTWTWVKGHSGIVGNEAADKLANAGADAWSEDRRVSGKRKRYDEFRSSLPSQKGSLIPVKPKSNLLAYFKKE